MLRRAIGVAATSCHSSHAFSGLEAGNILPASSANSAKIAQIGPLSPKYGASWLCPHCNIYAHRYFNLQFLCVPGSTGMVPNLKYLRSQTRRYQDAALKRQNNHTCLPVVRSLKRTRLVARSLTYLWPMQMAETEKRCAQVSKQLANI